jgi:hypothetical protein
MGRMCFSFILLMLLGSKCKGLLLYVGTKVFVLKPKPKNHPYNLLTSPKALPSQIGTAFELFIWKQ